jgi:hypothetical protein
VRLILIRKTEGGLLAYAYTYKREAITGSRTKVDGFEYASFWVLVLSFGISNKAHFLIKPPVDAKDSFRLVL